MKWLIFVCLFVIQYRSAIAQQTKIVQQTKNDSVWFEAFKMTAREADAHSHTGYKKYFRLSIDEMMKIYKAAHYKPDGSIDFDSTITLADKERNWIPFHPHAKALRTGKVATTQQYDQNSYNEIKYVPGSILINSFSPYEKQFSLTYPKRLISHYIVSGVGMDRLEAVADGVHTPHQDFLAEYYFNLIQFEEKRVVTSSPEFIYKKHGGEYRKNPVFYNKIRMMRDKKELDSALALNDIEFENWKSFNDTPHFITPMVMSVEGAQVLYDSLSGKPENILNPLNVRIPETQFYKGKDSAGYDSIKKELFKNVYSVKNLPHRMFCIILAHFAQNHVVGFAKSLDRDLGSISHRALATLTRIPPLRNNILRKTYAGFNPGCDRTMDDCKPDHFGLNVVDSFLNTTNTKYNKPTYIDVKHMDIKARIEYYYFRRNYEQRTKTHIPIIASHFAVSGEKQALAVATGLRPNFDRYDETEDQLDYYNRQIFRKDSVHRKSYWKEFMLGRRSDSLNHKLQVLDSMEKALYTPLNFINPKVVFDNKEFDPFNRSDTLRNWHLDSAKIGWYYPWSINLFDEEIIEINKSDGFIGIMMDPRQLGANMIKYKDQEKDYKEKYKPIAKSVPADTLKRYGLTTKDLDPIDYFKTEPFLRNIFYIVQVIKKQQLAEAFYEKSNRNYDSTKKKYKDYIADSLTCKKDPWNMITIGGDFDGFIDPIDFCPTAAYIPLLHRRMIIYSYIYAQLHKDEFYEEDKFDKDGSPLLYITSYMDSEGKMQQFFYKNLRDFIVNYF